MTGQTPLYMMLGAMVGAGLIGTLGTLTGCAIGYFVGEAQERWIS